jgi:hypothetical protein
MKSISLIGFAAMAVLSIACSTSNSIHEHSSTSFSKADSLTDAYLVLSDSVLHSWNRIVGNEIDKSRALQEIINDLDNASLLSDELRESFQVRMEQLERLRFTQESIKDPNNVQDYDLAFQSIVDDLSKLTKDNAELLFGKLQENSVLTRVSYDKFAKSFNDFLQENRTFLKDVNANNELDAKPLFVKVK